MNRTRKLLAIGATVVGFSGAGAVTAVAQTWTSTKTAVVTPAPSTDTDALQQGDHTTPDVPGATETPDLSEKPGTQEAVDQTDKPGTSNAETANDGPGGHADPPGTVDHQFDGQE